MFKTKGGAGGQRLFEQCSKKLRIWYRLAPLSGLESVKALIFKSPTRCNTSFVFCKLSQQGDVLELFGSNLPSSDLTLLMMARYH